MSLFFRTSPRQPAHTPHPAVTRLCRSHAVVTGPPLHRSVTRPIHRAPLLPSTAHRAPPPHPPPLVSTGVARPSPSPFCSRVLPYANSCTNHRPPPPLTSCPPPKTRASPTSMDFEPPPPPFPPFPVSRTSNYFTAESACPS
jgi:hypothetical protein